MYNQLIARAKADQEGILPMDDRNLVLRKMAQLRQWLNLLMQ